MRLSRKQSRRRSQKIFGTVVKNLKRAFSADSLEELTPNRRPTSLALYPCSITSFTASVLKSSVKSLRCFLSFIEHLICVMAAETSIVRRFPGSGFGPAGKLICSDVLTRQLNTKRLSSICNFRMLEVFFNTSRHFLEFSQMRDCFSFEFLLGSGRNSGMNAVF